MGISSDNIFSIAPIEICLDDRLTKMQIKVLLALLSFRAKNTDVVWPKRETLSARCGYCPSVISRVTSQLVELGWLQKVGGGGYSKSCEYRITVPSLETVTNSETVTESVTVTEPVTTTVTELVTRKELTNEQTSIKINKRSNGNVSLPDYMKAKKENGEKVIPEDDPVMAYAESVGIPPEFLRICWREFVESYSDGLKKYKDWRTVFRKAVRGNWFKLWWIDDQGAYQLTTTGRQALMAHKENGNG